jgi:hypothetical protein
MCVGETVVLTASGASTYSWIASVSFQVYSGNIINISPEATTVYTITATDESGCMNSTTFVQSVSECLGLAKFNGANGNLNVYPNPTAGEINIESGDASSKTFEVTDIAGKLVLSTSSSQETVKLNLTNLASGVYYVRITSETNMQVIRVIKQ